MPSDHELYLGLTTEAYDRYVAHLVEALALPLGEVEQRVDELHARVFARLLDRPDLLRALLSEGALGGPEGRGRGP